MPLRSCYDAVLEGGNLIMSEIMCNTCIHLNDNLSINSIEPLKSGSNKEAFSINADIDRF